MNAIQNRGLFGVLAGLLPAAGCTSGGGPEPERPARTSCSRQLVSSLLLLALVSPHPPASAVDNKVRALPAVGAGSGPRMWLRADAGITVDGSNRVSAWADQSGQGISATQSNPTARPRFLAAGAAGKPALGFDDTSTFLQLAQVPFASQQFSIAVYGRTRGAADARVYWNGALLASKGSALSTRNLSPPS